MATSKCFYSAEILVNGWPSLLRSIRQLLPMAESLVKFDADNMELSELPETLLAYSQLYTVVCRLTDKRRTIQQIEAGDMGSTVKITPEMLERIESDDSLRCYWVVISKRQPELEDGFYLRGTLAIEVEVAAMLNSIHGGDVEIRFPKQVAIADEKTHDFWRPCEPPATKARKKMMEALREFAKTADYSSHKPEELSEPLTRSVWMIRGDEVYMSVLVESDSNLPYLTGHDGTKHKIGFVTLTPEMRHLAEAAKTKSPIDMAAFLKQVSLN